MSRILYLLLIISLLASCDNKYKGYKQSTDVKMNDRGGFDVLTYVWDGYEIVAHRYNVDWRANDVRLSQLDSTCKVHKAWADSVINVFKSIKP